MILGEPGSGKTVTLLKLAESLIARTENNLSQPLPMVANLSSWAKQRQSIADWLVQELYDIYQVSKSLGNAWVKQGQLLLLLDGLDEVNVKYRNDCVKALNQFIQEHGLTEMVVCSRIRDYESLSERLKLRSAIYVQPLTSQQIDRFLERAGESLSVLKILLQQNAELQAFASSPLILSIMSLTYQGCSAEALAQAKTLEAQHKQLFDKYIDRMFTRRGTTRQHSREQTLHCLSWLAQRMVEASQTVFLIERLQPRWLPSPTQRVGYRIASGLIVGLIYGLIYGLIWRLIFGPALSKDALIVGQLIFGYIFGYSVELSFALIAGLMVGLSGNIKTVETLKWSWREAKKSFRNGLTYGLIGGLIFGLINQLIYVLISGGPSNQLIDVLIFGLIYGLFYGLTGGLIGGLIGGFRGPEIQQSNLPNQGIWRSAKNASILGLIGGLIFWLIFGQIFGLIGGLTCGMIVGLICGGSDSFRHFILRLMLYFQGNAPWNYTRFLDYASDRLGSFGFTGSDCWTHRI